MLGRGAPSIEPADLVERLPDGDLEIAENRLASSRN